MCMGLLFGFMFLKSIKLSLPLTASIVLLSPSQQHSLFFWFSILEHMFFSYFTSCGNINIHHIHIHNDYSCLSNMLNLCYYDRFPMKHFLHFNKLWTIYHFMSIQTTSVTCIWRCLVCFFTWLCCLSSCHYGLLFLLSSCFHIMIFHPTICVMFINLSCITLCFCWYYMFDILWY